MTDADHNTDTDRCCSIGERGIRLLCRHRRRAVMDEPTAVYGTVKSYASNVGTRWQAAGPACKLATIGVDDNLRQCVTSAAGCVMTAGDLAAKHRRAWRWQSSR